jgi:hypothetical protein
MNAFGFHSENIRRYIKTCSNWKDFSSWVQKLHARDRREQRASIKKKQKHPGYTMTGYNFCGPKISVDYVITTLVEAMHQCH